MWKIFTKPKLLTNITKAIFKIFPMLFKVSTSINSSLNNLWQIMKYKTEIMFFFISKASLNKLKWSPEVLSIIYDIGHNWRGYVISTSIGTQTMRRKDLFFLELYSVLAMKQSLDMTQSMYSQQQKNVLIVFNLAIKRIVLWP